jgi:gamma-glutamyl-gamma-aminobutyraldehyde dehydrogenase
LDQSAIDALRDAPISAGRLFINGRWVDAERGGQIESISPLNGQVLTTLAAAQAAEVDRAVQAARAAFEDGRWSRMAPNARGRILQAIGDKIAAEALPLAVLGVRDNGTEISMALRGEPGSAAATFRYYGELCDKTYGEIAPTAPGALGLVHHEPVGVVGAIVPWNFPLMIAAWKVAAALAAGNSVVLKPAEVASLSLLRLADICAECGLPDGVLNVVTGTGAEAGAALGLHADVDVLAFTGSGGVGRRLMEYSAQSNLKRVYLELGGKSPLVVFADTADLNAAADAAIGAIFRDSGQVCIAASRLIVERSIHAEFRDLLVQKAEAMVLGDPLNLTTQAGAIASSAQMEAILAACVRAQDQGATLVTGGARARDETGGFFITPTIFDDAPTTSDLIQKEIFGPVLAVQTFETEAEAVALANGTDYGLSAGVFTADLSRAHRMIAAIRAGVVHVNTYGGADATVPLGGVGQSGNGHDKSPHALDKFRNLKTAWIKL